MSRPGDAGHDTRLIAMGSAALMEGFAVIGFETWPDAVPQDVESVLATLSRGKERALVLLEPSLARTGTPALQRLRREGGRIVVVEVPPLQAPQAWRPEVEDLVVGFLGPGALEQRP